MQCVIADPPWPFHTSVCGKGLCPYLSVGVDQICALPVKNFFKPPCALFLWTTDAHLPQACRVMREWGFAYKTVYCHWVKIKKGNPVIRNGFYSKKSSEMLLLGAKGSI